jgi:hypothetical protein
LNLLVKEYKNQYLKKGNCPNDTFYDGYSTCGMLFYKFSRLKIIGFNSVILTVNCTPNALFGDFCNLSPCQCGSRNGLLCQSGICSYVEVFANIKFPVLNI